VVDEGALEALAELNELLNNLFDKQGFITYEQMKQITQGGTKERRLFELLSEHHGLNIKQTTIRRESRKGSLSVHVREGDNINKNKIRKSMKRMKFDVHVKKG
jgi:hypothetical protein